MANNTETATEINSGNFAGDLLSIKVSTEGGRHLDLTDYAIIALVYLLTNPDTEFDLPQESPVGDLRPMPSQDGGRYIHTRFTDSGFLSTSLPGLLKPPNQP